MSKAAGDQLAAVYADAYGLDLVRARPFNHAGPGQLPIFIVSSLAQQAAEGRLAGASAIRIVTGNPDTRRDFTDVRDVVRAYRLLAGAAAPAGSTTSARAGRSRPREQVPCSPSSSRPIEVEHEVDPARVRAHEVMDLRGSNERLRAATGWEPEIPFRQTMRDTLQWWERELRRAPPARRAELPHRPGGAVRH